MYQKKVKKIHTPAKGLTPLSDLGEFGLIDRLTRKIKIYHPETVKGVGDDAAVIGSGSVSGSNEVSLLSTDLLVEGIHFDLMYTPLRHLGYKAVVVNISDIAAMNGIPKQITVSIAVSSRFTAESLDDLYEGILAACNNYKVDLVGGDTSSSNKGLLITVSILGTAAKDEVIYRSGARPGDLLCVTGDLGAAYMGLLVLEREKKVFEATPGIQPDLSGFDYQVGRQLKPEARTDLRNLLSCAGCRPTAMIDISDGLASETLHLCKESGTGAKIFEERIPVDETTRKMAIDFNIIPSVAAISGGEDYELLFTIPQQDYEKIKEIHGISVIGHMTRPEEGKWLITPEGHRVELTAQGWDSFNEKSNRIK